MQALFQKILHKNDGQYWYTIAKFWQYFVADGHNRTSRDTSQNTLKSAHQRKRKGDNMITKYGFDSRFADEDTVFAEARDERFSLFGFVDPRNDTEYRRLPADVAEATSANVARLCRESAGGRVRFATDSPYIIIRSEMKYMADMPHFPRSGAAGFDLFVKDGVRYVFVDSFMPGKPENGYEWRLNFTAKGVREYMINFPLCSPVTNLYIGTKNDSTVRPGAEYGHKKPVVFYGSSITHGACAFRPGNTYEAIISNDLDCDYINLGFSGGALGEDAIADYIASLDMSVFVLDYDHNAPTPEHLAATHEKFFLRIRDAHPELPIIMVSRPCIDPRSDAEIDETGVDGVTRRREVILKTFTNAVARGDKNVAFIDGATLFAGPHADLCTTDRVHPNDAGFFRMADKIGAVVVRFLR